MQEVAVVLWEKLNEFDNSRDFCKWSRDFCKWACGVARFEVLAFLRDRARDRRQASCDCSLMSAVNWCVEIDGSETKSKGTLATEQTPEMIAANRSSSGSNCMKRWLIPQLRMTLLWLAVTSLTLVNFTASAADQPLRSRRVLYNFDGDSCLSTKAGSKGPVAVTVDDVKRLIEEVAYEGSRVDAVLVCVNAQVMYYPTKVGTMRGMLSTPEERAKWPASEKQRFENLKAFFDSGVDPYAVMLAEAKRRGREALVTIRMNDDHGDDFLRTQFMVDHPDWRLGTERYRGKGAIDFGREEVRDYTFRLIEEAMRRYDCDGLELDFNRFPTFFKDGTTEERVMKMNSLVERVRKMADTVGRERGRKLVLAVRVPSNYGRTPPTPQTALAIGCDVAAWAKNGWVDFVAVSEFLFERGNLPIAAWKQAIPSVPVYGGIECTRGGGNKNLTLDEYRAAGTKLVESGSDGVYLFNFFTSREGGANAYEPPFEVLKELGR